jgi:hypothetical protein
MSDEPTKRNEERGQLIFALTILSFACGALAVYVLKHTLGFG